MSANWDVDELEAKKDEITRKNLLKIDLKGDFGNVLVTPPTYTTILYTPEVGAGFDMDYFLTIHMPFAMDRWKQYGLAGYEVTQFNDLGGQKPKYSVQCVMKWDTPDGLEKAIQGPEAKEV